MKNLLLFASLFFTLVASGQSVERYVTGSGGGSNNIAGYTIDFTIGQTDAITMASGYMVITQGFQQPMAVSFRTSAELSGIVMNKNAVLKWRTPVEFNSDKFIIERAIDTLDIFTPLGTMPTRASNGNSMVPLFYTFKDQQELAQLTYYRIRLIAKDGSISYSNTIAVVASQQTWLLEYVYPNPVRTSFRIHLLSQVDAQASYVLVDVPGRILKTGTLHLVKGYNDPEILIANLPAGTYFLKLHNNNAAAGDLVGKIIKVN